MQKSQFSPNKAQVRSNNELAMALNFITSLLLDKRKKNLVPAYLCKVDRESQTPSSSGILAFPSWINDCLSLQLKFACPNSKLEVNSIFKNKKVCKDQELKQSELKSSSQNTNGKLLK